MEGSIRAHARLTAAFATFGTLGAPCECEVDEEAITKLAANPNIGGRAYLRSFRGAGIGIFRFSQHYNFLLRLRSARIIIHRCGGARCFGRWVTTEVSCS